MVEPPRKWTVEGDLDCWIWTGYCDVTGTPRIRTKEGNETARRVIWKRERGPIPEGRILHPLCGSRRCVRPRHMTPVTRAHQAYMTRQTALDHHDVNRARRLALQGWSATTIAYVFGVSDRTIRRVLKGDYWTLGQEKSGDIGNSRGS
jgi:hypothetical protein